MEKTGCNLTSADAYKNLAARYDITPGENRLLDHVMLAIRVNRPPVKESLPFTVFSSGRTLFLWVQTPACRFSVKGKCTICDYWDGRKLSSTVESVCRYIQDKSGDYDTLLLNTCGSVLDEQELSHDDLMRILRTVAKTPIRQIILETHLAFCDLRKVNELIDVLVDRELVIEFGQESSNPNVLLYCLNKPSMLNRYSILPQLRELGVRVLANVVLGAPFLCVMSRINDAAVSIRDLFHEGIDGVVLFPVNIKEHTLVWFLYEQGLYKRVEVREMVNVLQSLEAHELEHVELAWWEGREQNNTSYESEIIGPLCCKECGGALMSSLQQYSAETSGEKRKEIIDKAMAHGCDCERSLYNSNLPNIEWMYKFLRERFA